MTVLVSCWNNLPRPHWGFLQVAKAAGLLRKHQHQAGAYSSLAQVTAGQQIEAFVAARASARVTDAAEQEQEAFCWLNLPCGAESIQTLVEESDYWEPLSIFQFNNAPASKRDDSKPQIRAEVRSRHQGSSTSPWLLALGDEASNVLVTSSGSAMCPMRFSSTVPTISHELLGHDVVKFFEHNLS